MIPSLAQEDIAQYASNAQTIQEPTGTDYSRGVQVGKTIPAKWWNWLFSNVTKRIVQSRNDAANMLTELKNVVTDAGLTPSGSDNTQLAQAIAAKADTQIDDYVLGLKIGFTCTWAQLPVIIDGQDYSTGTRVAYLRVLVNGDSIFAYGDFYINNSHKGTYFSSDLVHWEKAEGIQLEFARGGVYLNGSCYMLSANYTFVGLYKAQASNPKHFERIYFDNSQASSDSYLPFITVVDGALYMFTYKGELYRINQNDTATLIDAPIGLGQNIKSQDTRYNPLGSFVKATVVRGRTFVGNIEVAGSVWTPLYTSTSPYTSAAEVLIKQLHNGNIAFIGLVEGGTALFSSYKVMDASGTILEGVTDVYSALSAEANDLLFARIDNTLKFSTDGLSFTAIDGYSTNTLRDVIQLQDKYFTVNSSRSTFLVTKDFVTFTRISHPVGMSARRVSLFVDGKHAVLSTNVSNAASTSFIVSYDEVLTPVNVVRKQLNGEQIISSYADMQYTTSVVTDTIAIANYNEILFKSVRAVNSVVGHTLYLR